MPSIPGGQETLNEGKGALADGLVYGLGTGIGGNIAGGIGHAAGGVVAGAAVGGGKGETLSTLAVANGLSMLMMGGGGQSSGRAVK